MLTIKYRISKPPCPIPTRVLQISFLTPIPALSPSRHSQFLENKLGEGLEKSFEFIQSLGTAAMHPSPGKGPSPQKKKGGTGGGSALSETAREGMSHVYRLIRQMRSSRNKFLGSVVRKFEQRADKVDLHFLRSLLHSPPVFICT